MAEFFLNSHRKEYADKFTSAPHQSLMGHFERFDPGLREICDIRAVQFWQAALSPGPEQAACELMVETMAIHPRRVSAVA
jgi:hypothetical protein